MRRAPSAPGGFSLLEVAIALAIVGIGVVTVLELFSAGLRVEQASGERARAVLYARTLLDQTVTLPEVVAGSDAGEIADGFRWERTVREAPEYTDGAGRDLELLSGWTMFEIEVSVLWPRGADREGVYTLRTLRVVPTAGT